MEPTGTHVDAIGIGDNVWVTQGKTEHMATFCGEPRKLVDNDSSDEDSDKETDNQYKGAADEIEVLIRWATTGTKNFVKASSVRPMIVGQRRRRQVVNHYQAVPSQRPGASNNNSKKKKKNNKKEETTIPKAKEEPDERQTDRSFRYKLFQKYQEEKREEQDRKEREEKRKEQEQKEREEKRKELEEKRREQERKERAEKRQEEERIEREEKRRERERKEREEKRQEQERKDREEKRREQEQKAQQEKRKAQEEVQKEQDRKVREEKRRERERKERKQQNDAESAAAAATTAGINSNEKPKMKFKLPTKEEFKRYQERKQRKKEEKRREKESAGKKRKRQTELEERFSSVNENENPASRTTSNDEEQLNNDTSENAKSAASNENENAASKTTSNDKGPLNNDTSENSKPAASEEIENADDKTNSNDKEPLKNDTSENSKPPASTPEAVTQSALTSKPAASAPGPEAATSALASEAVAKSTLASEPAASAPEAQSTLTSKLAASTTGTLSASSSASKSAASTPGVISESSSTSKPAASTPGTTSQSPSTSKQAASAHMSSTSKPVAPTPTPTPTPVVTAQSKSMLTAIVQEDNAKQRSTSGSSNQSRRISDSEVGGDESAVVVENNRKSSKRRKVSNSVLEDPKHTIDRGFQWEWVRNERGKYKMSKDQSSSARNSRIGTSRNVTKRANPSNFGKRKPKSFDEALAIIAEFKRCNKDGSCDVPSDHPLVGNFVNTLRAEYMKYRYHARRHKEDSISLYRREHKRSPRRDMTRVDSTRIKKLKKLGFQWRLSKKTTNPFVDTDDESNDVIGANSLDNSDNDSADGLDEPRKSRARSTSISSSASSSSSVLSSDDDEDLLNSYKDDHANDDDILIVSKLNDVSLTATTCLNRELARNRKPTLPIQLYRLLRLSAFNPKLGWQKIFRWTRDGNGFQIVDEQKFMSKIVSKSSKMNKAISFRNTLGQFNFMMVDNGDGKHGKYRVYEHKSIAEAAEEKDPSLRLFYRGATSETLWKIRTRKEECDDKRVGSEDETSQKEDRKSSDLDLTKPGDREKDRQRRRTSDGCLLPKHGADQLLLKDGTYEKPRGAIPNGLLWDKHRGLWAPPHLLTKGRDGKKKRLVPPRLSTTATKRNEVQQQHLAPNKKKQQTRLLGDRINNSRQPASERRTRDGCLLPRSEPFQYKDGTYKRPSGHQPRGLVWDEVRGLWVPAKSSKKRKFDASDSNRSSSSSSSEEDTMIIKASKAKIFQHSSSILRTYFQPKKKKQRQNGSAAYHSKSFQARTKKNPSGIVKHTINLTNWRKLEKLMQRSTRRQQNMAAVPPAAAITSNTFGDDEGEVRLI